MSENNDQTDLFVPLSDVIAGLRKELLTAKAATEDAISLSVEDIEVELTTVVTKTANGGVKLTVPFFGGMGVDAKGNYQDATTQKLKIKLKAEESIPLSEQPTDVDKPKDVDKPSQKRNLKLSDD